MHVYGEIFGTLTAGASISGEVVSAHQLNAELSIPAAVLPPVYEGATRITPAASAQVLETNMLFMKSDITIEPIPNNYGLITWDGSVITVS